MTTALRALGLIPALLAAGACASSIGAPPLGEVDELDGFEPVETDDAGIETDEFVPGDPDEDEADGDRELVCAGKVLPGLGGDLGISYGLCWQDAGSACVTPWVVAQCSVGAPSFIYSGYRDGFPPECQGPMNCCKREPFTDVLYPGEPINGVRCAAEGGVPGVCADRQCVPDDGDEERDVDPPCDFTYDGKFGIRALDVVEGRTCSNMLPIMNSAICITATKAARCAGEPLRGPYSMHGPWPDTALWTDVRTADPQYTADAPRECRDPPSCCLGVINDGAPRPGAACTTRFGTPGVCDAEARCFAADEEAAADAADDEGASDGEGSTDDGEAP